VEKRDTGQGELLARGKKCQAEQVVEPVAADRSCGSERKPTEQACREAGIVEQTYYRWREEYGGLQVDQARRLKELGQENAKLKRLVSELSL
jgi:putative transposase